MTIDRQEIIARIEASAGPIDLSGLDLQGVDLSRLDLRGANLSRADLTAADLRWTVLEGADLQATVLRRADARWAILRGATLRQADLGRTNLSWADLSGADLTDAQLDGANLESVDLSDVHVERRRAPRIGGTAGAGGSIAEWLGGLKMPRPGTAGGAGEMRLPALTPASAAAAGLLVIALAHCWGWLYRRAYFVDGFGLRGEGVIGFWERANVAAGLVEVVGLTLLTLLASPLILIGAALVLAAAAALPAAAFLIAQRLLRDVVRPSIRPIIVGGLFVAFFVAFYLLIPPAVAAADALGDTLPTGPRLGAIVELFRAGGWLTKLGLVAALGAAAVPAWTAWRWLSHRFARWEAPAAWRLRYPTLNSALTDMRHSRVFAQAAPLTEAEARRGLAWLAGVVLALATLVAGVGRVHAADDMCDGGRLPRVQLYAEAADEETEFEPTVDARDMCARMLLETEDEYFVFFPAQTESGDGDGERVATVHRVPVADVGFVDRTTSEHECPTCVDGVTGLETALIDPSEEIVSGIVVDFDAETGFLMLDFEASTFQGATPTVLVRQGQTEISVDGREAGVDAIEPDLAIVAFGRVEGEADAAYLDARELRIVTDEALEPGPGQGPAVPEGFITVDLTDPRNPRVSGTGWTEGAMLEIGVARLPAGDGVDLGGVALTGISSIQVPPGLDGTFDAPLGFDPRWPTGPDLSLVVRDIESGQAARGPWLISAPPTLTPVPTAVPTIIRETTPTPEGGEEPTEEPTAEPAPTNTPLPTAILPGGVRGGVGVACEDPDPFEPDDTRGLQKEILVGLGEPNLQDRNFCSSFDIDLAWFPVKGGRWYRVSTTNLAPGVDTVMAVGDLHPETYCVPFDGTWGCWSDDRGSLTFESEIVFLAREDGRAMITVDNRGSAWGAEATYQLGVELFEPEATGTPTVGPTRTPEPTKTATATPLPLTDVCEKGTGNNRCRYAETCPLQLGIEVQRTIWPREDIDYFEIELGPGVYEVIMRPPPGMNYDLEVGQRVTRDDCTVFVGGYSVQSGDAVERIEFGISATMTVYVRVDTFYPTVFFDPFSPYRLVVRPLGAATATPPPTVFMTSTPPPPPTATPTRTPTIAPPMPLETETPIPTLPPPTATPTETPASTPTATDTPLARSEAASVPRPGPGSRS